MGITMTHQPDDKAAGDSLDKVTPYYFDAVKLVGTGNSTGLFGAGVALYYFSAKSPDVLSLIKWDAFIYLVGVCLFSVAYFCLSVFTFIRTNPARTITNIQPWLHVGVVSAFLSFVVWWVGTICAGVVFARL